MQNSTCNVRALLEPPTPKKHTPTRPSSSRGPTTSQYYFVLQSLHKTLPSTTLYYKACTKHFPVLLCTTKLAHFTSQYYFVLQSLHKTLPSTTLYYKACTLHFPVLLCTTKLARSTSQYYFVLQSCTEHAPALLCTTKLAQNTSQYYFVLQSLHKALPSTTVYYKACANYFPVLLWPSNLNAAMTSYNGICRDWVAKHNRTTRSGVGNCSSKSGSRRQSDKKTISKHFLEGILKGKFPAPKLRKSADKSLSQPWCSHSNTIYNLQLQKTIVLRMQPRHQATLTQPLQCDLRRPSCKAQ